ncbi:MAG: hypothetical protein KF729_37275 [Sandaracinaceae bacterium]|nr:hypothetical protein [Sandaracinaceae bacterium]
MRTLLGNESVPVRGFAIAFAGLAGMVLGATVLLVFAREAWGMLALGAIPGVASAFVVARATRRRRRDATGSIIGLSVLAAVLCPFAAMTLLLLTAGAPGGSQELLFFACLGGGVGAFFAAPFGLVLGALYAWVWQRLDACRAHGRAALEDLWMRFGDALLGVGGISLVIALVPGLAYGSGDAADLLLPLAGATVLVGALARVLGVLLARERRRLAREVREGAIAGWAVVPAEEIEDAAALPSLFAASSGEVLVRRAAGACGPFRSCETIEPVARL